MVACLPLVQQVRGSIPGGVVNFNLKIFNLGARKSRRRKNNAGTDKDEENKLAGSLAKKYIPAKG